MYTSNPSVVEDQVVCYDIRNNRDPNVGNITSIQTGDEQGAGYTISATNRQNTAGIDVTLSDIDGNAGQNSINMDRNGNAIDYFSAYPGQNTDSFGRNPFPVRQGDRQSDPNHIYVVGSDGSTQTYTLTYSTYSVIVPPNAAGTATLLSSIAGPNGTYSFTYDSGTTGLHNGSLLTMTLPTGGQVAFGYSQSGNSAGYVNSISYGGGTWNLTYNVIINGGGRVPRPFPV